MKGHQHLINSPVRFLFFWLVPSWERSLQLPHFFSELRLSQLLLKTYPSRATDTALLVAKQTVLNAQSTKQNVSCHPQNFSIATAYCFGEGGPPYSDTCSFCLPWSTSKPGGNFPRSIQSNHNVGPSYSNRVYWG